LSFDVKKKEGKKKEFKKYIYFYTNSKYNYSGSSDISRQISPKISTRKILIKTCIKSDINLGYLLPKP
jgi:hypothetical protein